MFIYFLGICWLIALFFSIFYVYKVLYGNLLVSLNLSVILFIVVLGGFCFFKLLFYSVTATKKGLETAKPIGSNQSFTWEEIIEVRRPRFGIPYDFSYVISKNKEKLLLVRSMQNYKELVELIKTKAPNLQKCKS